MFKKIFCFTAALIALAAAWTVNSVKFAEGKAFELYCESSSSSAKICAADACYASELLRTGEKITLSLGEEELRELIKSLGVKEVFTEKTEFGTSYYGYSDKLKYRKTIKKKVVNFHAFKGKTEIVVGTPIIFGGY